MAVAVETAPSRIRLGGAIHAVVSTTSAAVVVALFVVINCVAAAGLICSGPLAPGLLVGFSALLAGAAASAVVIGLTSGHRGMASTPISANAVVYAVLATVVAQAMPGLDPIGATRAVMIVCGAVTIFAGLACALIGAFRLGSLARFLPYPVVSGYNAGTGWLFIVGGLTVASGLRLHGRAWFDLLAPDMLPHIGATLGLAVILSALSCSLRHWAVVPLTLLGGLVAFHAMRLLLGAGLESLEGAGWMLGPFPAESIWSAPEWSLAARVPWTRLPGLGSLALTILLVGATTIILLVSGLELELRRPMDVNRELRAAGLGSVVAGTFGGIMTTISVPITMVAHHIGASTRTMAVMAGAACGILLLVRADTLDAVPRFLIAALLLSNGFDRLIDRVWKERHRLPKQEMAALLIVLFAVIWRGIVQGVGVGLGLTLLMFVWNYRRIPVVRLSASGAIQRSSMIRSREAEEALLALGSSVRLCRLQGYLFFLNAVDLLKEVPETGLRFLILDFRGVVGVDTSACLIFRRLHQLARERGFALVLTGMAAKIRTQLRQHGVAPAWPEALSSCDTSDKALSHAEDTLLGEAIHPLAAASSSFAALIGDAIDRAVDQPRLALYLRRLEVEAGSVLIRQDDPADALYFIAEGTVSVHIDLPDGRREHLRTAQAGTIMGELGIYAGKRRTATVLADTDCRVDRLSAEEMDRMERDDPDLASVVHRAMTTLIADKLAGSNRIIEQLMR